MRRGGGSHARGTRQEPVALHDPRRRRTGSVRGAIQDLELGDFVQLGGLPARIGNGYAHPAQRGADLDAMPVVRGLANRDGEHARLPVDRAGEPNHVPQVGVAPLVERPQEPNPRLNRHHHAGPRDCHGRHRSTPVPLIIKIRKCCIYFRRLHESPSKPSNRIASSTRLSLPRLPGPDAPRDSAPHRMGHAAPLLGPLQGKDIPVAAARKTWRAPPHGAGVPHPQGGHAPRHRPRLRRSISVIAGAGDVGGTAPAGSAVPDLGD